ncbi:uncharacterized protein [Pyrus communis]|uniref:uncharacterized protein n=1 Tax=Pyrus communis TaxID=23211 RepID=UPI0035BED20D
MDDTSNSSSKLGSTSVASVVPVVIPSSTNHGEKPEKFNGTDFKRWQQKMLFYLTTLNLAKFPTEDTPVSGTTVEKVAAIDAWNHSDFLCKNYILNALDNALYNVYSPIKSAKALWNSLDKIYKTEDAGMKKFVVGRFLDYKVTDSKKVISQVQELQLILHEIHVEGMSLSETFQVAVDNRYSEKKSNSQLMQAKTHIVKGGPKNNKKRKHSGESSSQGNFKKFKGKCFACNKTGHHASECRNRKGQDNSKKKSNEVHITEEERLSKKISDINLVTVVSEVNMVGNTKEWWVDTKATCHICSDRKMFTTYQEVTHGEQLFMGNSSTSKVQGLGKFVQTRGGKIYFITFIDDCTRYCYVYLLRSKDEALEAFTNYKNEVENQLSKKIKVIRSNRGENEPQTYKEAISSSAASFWKEAINAEIESIMQNHTWELVDLPPGNKPLGYKWIFKRKMKADGSSDKYKARLVAKVIHNLEIHQMDVKAAFLNGDLGEEIYMEQHEGFIVHGRERKNYGLHFTRCPAVLEGYYDANWISDT